MYQNPYFQFGPQYQSPVPVKRPFIQNIPVAPRSIYQGIHVPNHYVQNQQLFQGLQQDQTPYIQSQRNLERVQQIPDYHIQRHQNSRLGSLSEDYLASRINANSQVPEQDYQDAISGVSSMVTIMK